MSKWSKFYIFRIQFLGYRYHGWQKQPDVKTIEGVIERTMRYVLDGEPYKILGCGRTDALVSAEDFAFELFTNQELELEILKNKVNENLPADILVNSVEETDKDFNIINHPKIKEYHYHFSFGEKTHPFNAPFIRYFQEEMHIEAMMEAAKLFLGEHNFRGYVTKPTENTQFNREILLSEIVRNNDPTSPKNAYIYKVKSGGFMRYQVRHMVGVLLEVGRENWSLEDIKETLENPPEDTVKFIAPAAGLRLHKLDF